MELHVSLKVFLFGICTECAGATQQRESKLIGETEKYISGQYIGADRKHPFIWISRENPN